MLNLISLKPEEINQKIWDMNNSGFCKLRPLDVMNRSGFWMIWMILHHELNPLDALNDSGLWMIWTIMGHELKALDVVNDMNDTRS